MKAEEFYRNWYLANQGIETEHLLSSEIDLIKFAEAYHQHMVNEQNKGCAYFTSSNTALNCDNCGKHRSEHNY